MRSENRRKRIAFLGGGIKNIPSYVMLLTLLSDEYDITLYSEFFLNPKEPARYRIKSVPLFRMPGRVREIWFASLVLFDQLFWRADIFHAHSTFPSGLVAVLLAKLFRKPVLVAVNAGEGVELKSIGFGDLLDKRRARINRFVLNNADAVTTLSHYHKSLLIQNIEIKQEIRVIPRGVDLRQFQFAYRDIKHPVRFLNVAYIHPVKGQEMLLKCFSVLARKFDCTLVHIGRDLMDGKLQKMSAELGINDKVQFLGPKRHGEMNEFYRNADILLHTSLHEALPSVVCEALASGLLVCGTDVGLMADLSGQCTISVKPDDYEGLANKIEMLLSNSEQINTLRINGKKWAEEHDILWTKNEYRNIYESLS